MNKTEVVLITQEMAQELLGKKEIGPVGNPAQQESGNKQTVQQVVEVVKRATMNERVSRPKLVLIQFRLRQDQREWLQRKASEGFKMNELVRRLIDKEMTQEEMKASGAR